MALALIALVVVLRVWIQIHGALPGDKSIVHTDFEGHSILLEQIAEFYGVVGGAVAAALTVVAAMWAVCRHGGGRAAMGLAAAAAVILLCAALKGLWGPTPLWEHIRPAGSVNYPSGHVAYATAVFGYLAVVGRARREPVVVVTALVLIIGMGPARIIAGAHLMSDATAGYLLGAGWLILVVLMTWPQNSASAMAR